MKPIQINRRSVLAAAGLALPTLAIAQDAAGPFRFTGWRGAETDAERGFLEVPEDRSDPASRTIRLGYVRFPSTSPNPGNPIVYLSGGPGGTGTGTATGPRFPIFMALRAVADVIAFDQRGTGLSASIPPLDLAPLPIPPLTRMELTGHVREAYRAAWDAWTARGIGMRGYTTAESADDLDALRVHLGAERIDLWGISYGSHLALSALRRHPDRIGRVALASLEGQDQTVKRPDRLDLYLDRVDALLDGDASLRAAVPSLAALMRRVHARMEAEPLALASTYRGAPVEAQVGGFAVQMLAGGLIANPSSLALLPSLYLALEAGETAVLSRFFGQMEGLLDIAGMPETMDLASGISPARAALVAEVAPASVLGDALNFPMPHLSGVVPGLDLGETFRAPLAIDTPALLVAGTLDGRTPLEEQAEVVDQFRNRSRIIVENAGHNVFEAHPEVQDLLVRFFAGEAVSDTHLTLPPPVFPPAQARA